MTLQLGDSFTVRDKDGNEHSDIVHGIRYRSAQTEIRQQLTGWRRIVRNLTPHRWRKPLPIARPYRPVEMEVIGDSEIGRRAQRVYDDIAAAIDRLL